MDTRATAHIPAFHAMDSISKCLSEVQRQARLDARQVHHKGLGSVRIGGHLGCDTTIGRIAVIVKLNDGGETLVSGLYLT